MIDWKREELRTNELWAAPVTVAKVYQLVDLVRASASDPERAHELEDELHEHVLRAIGEGHDEAAALAQACMTTRKVTFRRWYA